MTPADTCRHLTSSDSSTQPPQHTILLLVTRGPLYESRNATNQPTVQVGGVLPRCAPPAYLQTVHNRPFPPPPDTLIGILSFYIHFFNSNPIKKNINTLISKKLFSASDATRHPAVGECWWRLANVELRVISQYWVGGGSGGHGPERVTADLGWDRTSTS